FYGDFVFKFFSLDSILFALFDILTLFQGRLYKVVGLPIEKKFMITNFRKYKFSIFIGKCFSYCTSFDWIFIIVNDCSK
ncbi:hypothetical protein, partial [Leptospira kirschneri]|uniref:hypothetical protein n=1 Tax=Leptospira kirschneri TaxID=29507 RepID=UPI001E418A5D